MPVFPDLTSSTPLSIDQAMRTAIAAAERVKALTYPNPPVGCVVLDAAGIPVGVGATEPAGGLHAEPQALRHAGVRAAGGVAVVTLEPCHHYGKTPPCTKALVEAGIRKVVFAVSDPNPVAAGGAQWLAQQGIDVTDGVLGTQVAHGVLRPWLHWQQTRTPHITVKTASTIDGLAAATDGSSQWITGEAARAEVHRDRSHRDAIIVGTGTVLADNPRLTARKPDGGLYDHQPMRIVVGTRDIPADAAIRGDGENFRHIRTNDMEQVVDVLADLGLIDVVVEGGPRLAGAFLNAGLVDAIDSYIAPSLLGAGTAVVDSSMATSISDIARFSTIEVATFGDDVRIRAVRNFR